MRPSLHHDSRYSYVPETSFEEAFFFHAQPQIVPTEMVILDEPSTTPGDRRWIPCTNCTGIDIADAEERCPTCDGHKFILTMKERVDT